MKRIYIKPAIKTLRMYPHTFITTSSDTINTIGEGSETQPLNPPPGNNPIYGGSRYNWDDLTGDE